MSQIQVTPQLTMHSVFWPSCLFLLRHSSQATHRICLRATEHVRTAQNSNRTDCLVPSSVTSLTLPPMTTDVAIRPQSSWPHAGPAKNPRMRPTSRTEVKICLSGLRWKRILPDVLRKPLVHFLFKPNRILIGSSAFLESLSGFCHQPNYFHNVPKISRGLENHVHRKI